MQSIIDNIHSVLGQPNFMQHGVLQLDQFIVYFVAAILLILVVSSILKIVVGVFTR